MDRLERVGIHGQQMLRDVLTAITTAHQPPRPENHNSTARETDSEKVIRLLLEELRELRKQQR
jgi:hypothetical protein